MTKMAAMPIYGKNPSKIFFSGSGGPIFKKGVKHLWLKYYKAYINHDPVMTLTHFMARSTWVDHAFKWGKLLKCHLKGKASRKLANGQNIDYSEKKEEPQQPIKISDQDECHLKRRALLNKHFSKNKTQISPMRKQKFAISTFFHYKSMGRISCHGNQSSYPI